MVDIIFIVSVAIEGLPNQATTKTLEKSSVSSSAQGQAMVLSLFSIKWKQKNRKGSHSASDFMYVV